jgi:predicted metal-dependent HD superfamily phosphohydrolase
MLSPERIDARMRGWYSLLAPLGIPPAEIYQVFDELVVAYSQPHRHYHTLEHIDDMLRVIGKLASLADEPFAVQLACWFHDAVYDPHADDNEARSAEWAERVLAGWGLAPLATRVAQLVLATRHGDCTVGISEPSRDAAVLLDADLAILAAPQARYDRYAAGIRREYAWVPEEQYRLSRAGVLREFLARPRIYHTTRLFEEGEALARLNIERELAKLEGTEAVSA